MSRDLRQLLYTYRNDADHTQLKQHGMAAAESQAAADVDEEEDGRSARRLTRKRAAQPSSGSDVSSSEDEDADQSQSASHSVARSAAAPAPAPSRKRTRVMRRVRSTQRAAASSASSSSESEEAHLDDAASDSEQEDASAHDSADDSSSGSDSSLSSAEPRPSRAAAQQASKGVSLALATRQRATRRARIAEAAAETKTVRVTRARGDASAISETSASGAAASSAAAAAGSSASAVATPAAPSTDRRSRRTRSTSLDAEERAPAATVDAESESEAEADEDEDEDASDGDGKDAGGDDDDAAAQNEDEAQAMQIDGDADAAPIVSRRKKGAKRRRTVLSMRTRVKRSHDGSALGSHAGNIGPPCRGPFAPSAASSSATASAHGPAGASSSSAPLQPGAPRFRCMTRVREGHGQPIYCVAFNTVDARHKDVFASAGGNRVTVYRALASGALDPLQLYVDPDPREVFYSLCWSIDLRTGAALLLMGGESGAISVLDTHTRRLVRRLVGHGGSVNDLRLHPLNVSLLLSASKDSSLRVWNLSSGDQVAVCAGDGGHRDEALSADWHPSGRAIVSAGLDHSVMLWSLDEPAVRRALTLSFQPSHLRPHGRPFPTALLQRPAASSARVHDNYVDHVRCVGDLILSKSTKECIVLWGWRQQHSGSVAGGKQENGDADGVASSSAAPHSSSSLPPLAVTPPPLVPLRLREYVYSDCDIWYMRFCLDAPRLRLLCVGNLLGAVFLWRLDDPPGTPPRKLTTPQSQRAVRCVAFSSDGATLIAACEDGSLFRWEQIVERNAPVEGKQ